MQLCQRLAAAIGDRHRQIEQTRLARDMIEGRVDRQTYLMLLSQLHHIHAALEAALDSTLDAWPSMPEVERRSATARRDLETLGQAVPRPPLPTTKALIGCLEEWARMSTPALLGVLYVLEGSRMGSMGLASPLAAALNVPTDPRCGLDYHLDGMAERPMLWRQFKEHLNALSLPPPQQMVVLAGAAIAMRSLCDLYDLLSRPPLTVLNVESPRAVAM